jgi:hypothetical protein
MISRAVGAVWLLLTPQISMTIFSTASTYLMTFTVGFPMAILLAVVTSQRLGMNRSTAMFMYAAFKLLGGVDELKFNRNVPVGITLPFFLIINRFKLVTRSGFSSRRTSLSLQSLN